MNKIFYFTGTGNSYYAAKKIGEELGFELVNIAEVIDGELDFSGEKMGIVFPVYAMGIPQMVGKFLTRLKISGNPYIFSIGTCGGSGYGIPFALIESLLKDKRSKGEKKLELSYSSYLQMPDNYLKLFKMKNSEEVSAMLETADSRLESKIEELRGEKKNSYIKFFINPLFKMFYMLWLNNLKKADRNFLVKENCISCNICREICPSRNIQMENGKPIWKGRCQDCMGCINLCPVSAIEIGKKTQKRGRYHNPFVPVEELKLKNNFKK